MITAWVCFGRTLTGLEAFMKNDAAAGYSFQGGLTRREG